MIILLTIYCYFKIITPHSHLVVNNGGKLNMQVSREPIVRFQMVEQLLCRWTAQSTISYFLCKESLASDQAVDVAKVIDSTWPIVGHENIQRQLYLPLTCISQGCISGPNNRKSPKTLHFLHLLCNLHYNTNSTSAFQLCFFSCNIE